VELEKYVAPRLETNMPFMIVAESFSGPLAIRLAAKKPKNLVAVILCAAFIKNPLPRMSRFIRLGVVKLLLKLPLPEFLIRKFLVGRDAPRELVVQCRNVIQAINSETLASRFGSVVKVNVSQKLLDCPVPILYLCAKADKIISRKSLHQIKTLRPNIEVVFIDAPHFLLQRAPQAALAAIKNFLNGFLLFLILLGCGKKYEYIEPRTVATLQVNFKDQSGSARNTISLYSVPDEYAPEQAWPLVVALHGYGDNAAAFHDLWKSVTDSLGFVLLTPQGEERAQQGFGWAWGISAQRAVQSSLDIVRKVVHIDPKRIYLTDLSRYCATRRVV
jgi:alpha-beta hydrolase superfamily lysophospholipase